MDESPEDVSKCTNLFDRQNTHFSTLSLTKKQKKSAITFLGVIADNSTIPVIIIFNSLPTSQVIALVSIVETILP
jgi:hypothetical protein